MILLNARSLILGSRILPTTTPAIVAGSNCSAQLIPSSPIPGVNA